MAMSGKINLWGVIGVSILALSLLSGISAAFVFTFRQGYSAGTNAERLLYQKTQNIALQAAMAENERINARLQETERMIYEDSKNDTGVLPDSIRRQLERMRRNETMRDGGEN